MGNLGRSARRAFAALAASALFTSNAATAPAQPFFIPGPSQQSPSQGVTQDDLNQLNAYFNAASKSYGDRATDKCEPALDGRGTGHFTNADIGSIASMNQLMEKLPASNVIRYKLLATYADKLGWTVCVDNRMPDLGVNFSINVKARVIGLNPAPFTGPPAATALQMNFAAALNTAARITQNFTAEPEGVASMISVPFSGNSNPTPRMEASDKNIIFRLQPAPVKGATIPYEAQKAMGLWQV